MAYINHTLKSIQHMLSTSNSFYFKVVFEKEFTFNQREK